MEADHEEAPARQSAEDDDRAIILNRAKKRSVRREGPSVRNVYAICFALCVWSVLTGEAPVHAQQSATLTAAPAKTSKLEDKSTLKTAKRGEHHFWDRKNDWLFAGVAASRALDYSSTLNMRRRGRQEILVTNDVVDNHAGFAALEAAGVGVAIAGSYLFHHYGHHKLERWTSYVHISLATSGAIRNYCLKTADPGITP
jgi:hypothetical protein